MNAFMNIQIRVAANNAAATLRALRSGVGDLNTGLATTTSRSGASSKSLSAWGNQLQWTGRQIQTNWTLPLMAAGYAATKTALANEAAMTRVAKVYGDASMSASTITNELNSLGKAFEALSNHFGVAQSEVLGIAGDWAAAGASGSALFTGVRTTLEAMVLGEMKAADATKALIAIQAQYGTDAAGLAKIIGTLNSVENATGVSMSGLIQGFQRSAGVARQAGVDYRHLAAMIAALSPAAGGAAEAGNALKTIFSRLASPTKETTQVLGLMGISMKDMNWQSSSATEQLQILTKKFADLSDKQKEVVSTVVASRWQINKFSILMRELGSENGYYQKALDSTSDSNKIFTQYQKELNKVLESSPQRMKQIWTMLQNASADIIQPMIPVLLYLANAVRIVVQSFSDLNPSLQKLILFAALAVAMIGPLLRYVGSAATLLGALGGVIRVMLVPFGALLGAVGTLMGYAWSGLVTAISAAATALVWLGNAAGLAAGRIIGGLMLAISRLPAMITAMWPVIVSSTAAAMTAISTVMTLGGILISAAWAATVAGLGMVFGPAARAILLAWRQWILGIQILTSGLGSGLSRVWSGVWFAMTQVMISTARIMGMVWRLATMQISVITMGWGPAFARLWMGIQFLIEQVLIAGAATLGVIWRGALAIIAATTTAFRPLLGAAWAGTFGGMFSIFGRAAGLIALAWRQWMLGLQILTSGLGAGLGRVWSMVWVAMGQVMISSARILGMLWRMATMQLSVITMGWGAAFSRLWMGIQFLTSQILVAGAATLGVIWRGALAVITATTTAWRPIFAAGWAGFVAIARAGAVAMSSMAALGSRGMMLLVMAPARLAVLFRGGWAMLLSVARFGVSGLISIVGGVVSAVGWPVIAAVAAVVLIVAGFWDQIKAGFNAVIHYFTSSGAGLAQATRNIFGGIGDLIARVFNLLPNSVKNAMLAVVKIVSIAAHKVYDLFSYINPFAHHSPSLVENVTNGMDVVKRQFAGLKDVEGYVKSAYDTLQQFGGAAASMGDKYQNAQFADQRVKLAKVDPSALPDFDALVNQIKILTPILRVLDAEVKDQQQVVRQWSDQLDAANAALDVQQKQLDAVKKNASDLSDKLDAAKQALTDWSNTPIQGQRAMSDAIFANQQASKALQLQLMKMENASGSLDDIKNKMASINGEIDTLRGLRADLAQGGAGSDILSVYDNQIKSLQGSGGGLSGQAKAMQDLQTQIDELGKQGQQLDLENSLQFDGLTRQIEQASNSMKEMPFDVIMAGVQASKADIDKLTTAYNAANQAVADQQKVVDAATAARDAIQARYDAEQKKLQNLRDAYDAVNGAIGDINDSLQLMNQYADDALNRAKGNALSPGAQNFLDAAGGNFPDVGGNVQIGREGGNADQSALIDQMTQDMAKQTSDMFKGLNPIEPLKKWWDKGWNWLKTYVGPLFTALGGMISDIFSKIGNPFAGASSWGQSLSTWITPAVGMLKSFGDTFMNIFSTVWGWLQQVWGYIQPVLAQLWSALVQGVMDAWAKISPQIEKFKELFGPIGDMFANLWTIIKPILAVIVGALAAAFLLIVDILKNTVGPIFELIGSIIADVIQVLRGVIEFIVGVFTGNWKLAWQGIKDVFGGVWNLIVDIVSGAWNIIWGVLKGAMQWVGQVFALLWDKAIVPAWNAAWGWISKTGKSAWDGIIGWLKDAYNWVVNVFAGAMNWVKDKFMGAWNTLTDWFGKAADWIKKPLKDAINGTLIFVNALIHGLNKVADILPGLDWHIGDIPLLMAAGGAIPGRRVGNGFVTNGARAIVGEGNPVHPEFVIPTDPSYRGRALGLFKMLGRQLGVDKTFAGGVPMFKKGGILGALGSGIDFVGGLASDALKHIGDGVATYVMKPIFALADPLINKIPWDFAKKSAHSFEKTLLDWVSQTDDAARKKVDEGGIGRVPAGQVRDWISQALAIMSQPGTIAPGIYNIIMHESGGNPRAINLWDSNAQAGHPSKGLMQTIDSTFSQYAMAGHGDIWNPVDNIIAGTRYALSRYGASWLAAGGNKDKSGNYIGYAEGGILNAVYRAMPSLANGAYIRRTVGGTVVRVGEGATDEAVIPLPRGFSPEDMSGSKTYNFYGDLSFPNITSGEDAKTFLDNLQNLAGA